MNYNSMYHKIIPEEFDPLWLSEVISESAEILQEILDNIPYAGEELLVDDLLEIKSRLRSLQEYTGGW